MKHAPKWTGEDRRSAPRVAGQGSLRAAVIDAHGQASSILKEAQVVNVSGGGLAFTTTGAAPVGSKVNLRIGDGRAKPFDVRIVGVKRRGDGRSELRAQLVQGSIPACLMYDW